MYEISSVNRRPIDVVLLRCMVCETPIVGTAIIRKQGKDYEEYRLPCGHMYGRIGTMLPLPAEQVVIAMLMLGE